VLATRPEQLVEDLPEGIDHKGQVAVLRVEARAWRAVVEDERVAIGRAGLPQVERAAVGEGGAGQLGRIYHAANDARSLPADSAGDSKTPRGTSVSMRPPPRLMQAPVAELDASTERDR
jgi:hypothetical protein